MGATADLEEDLARVNDKKLMTINHGMNVVVQSRRVVTIEKESEVLVESDQMSI